MPIFFAANVLKLDATGIEDFEANGLDFFRFESFILPPFAHQKNIFENSKCFAGKLQYQ
jgi:hypothetical protein